MKRSPENPEFSRFTIALQDVLSVSKEEMTKRMEEQKEKGKRLSKGSASLGSAASAKIRASLEH